MGPAGLGLPAARPVDYPAERVLPPTVRGLSNPCTHWATIGELEVGVKERRGGARTTACSIGRMDLSMSAIEMST